MLAAVAEAQRPLLEALPQTHRLQPLLHHRPHRRQQPWLPRQLPRPNRPLHPQPLPQVGTRRQPMNCWRWPARLQGLRTQVRPRPHLLTLNRNPAGEARCQPATLAAAVVPRQAILVLVAVAVAALGPALKWEPSRGGDLFPHLYGPLPASAATSVVPLPLGADGGHIFPPLTGEAA